MPNEVIFERENTWTAHIKINSLQNASRESLLSNFGFQKFPRVWFIQGVVDVWQEVWKWSADPALCPSEIF